MRWGWTPHSDRLFHTHVCTYVATYTTTYATTYIRFQIIIWQDTAYRWSMANKLPNPSRHRALFQTCPECGDGIVMTTRENIDDDDGQIKCESCGQQYRLSPV